MNIGALIYGVAAIVNLSWPRDSHQPWYDDYIIALMSVAVVGLGILYMACSRAASSKTSSAVAMLSKSLMA